MGQIVAVGEGWFSRDAKGRLVPIKESSAVKAIAGEILSEVPSLKRLAGRFPRA